MASNQSNAKQNTSNTLLLSSGILAIVYLAYQSLIPIIRAQKVRYSPYLLLSKYRNLARYLEAQARHETGNYKARIFTEHKNLFGMKVPNVRPADQAGMIFAPDLLAGHARFDNAQQSIRDMLLYLEYVNFPTDVKSVDQFVMALKDRNYFEDSYDNYKRGVQFFYDRL